MMIIGDFVSWSGRVSATGFGFGVLSTTQMTNQAYTQEPRTDVHANFPLANLECCVYVDLSCIVRVVDEKRRSHTHKKGFGASVTPL
jgi:hypothetical protein